jgi:hypothetical protein
VRRIALEASDLREEYERSITRDGAHVNGGAPYLSDIGRDPGGAHAGERRDPAPPRTRGVTEPS